MLVLSRKRNESLVIGDDVEILITEIRGNRVRLGIQAPRHVTVYRKEVCLESCEKTIRGALLPDMCTV